MNKFYLEGKLLDLDTIEIKLIGIRSDIELRKTIEELKALRMGNYHGDKHLEQASTACDSMLEAYKSLREAYDSFTEAIE